MSITGLDSHRRVMPKASLPVVATVLIVLVAGVAWALKMNRREALPAASGEGLRVLLAVEPFVDGDSVPAEWDASSFADSLAAQLSRIQGIHATTQSAKARYVLRGHVSVKEGRLVLAARLGRDGERDTVWSATFWRSASSGSSVLTDLAQAVAEAAFSQSTRESFNQKREKP